MLSVILGFFFFIILLFLASFIGVCSRCLYEWIEYERVPSLSLGNSFSSLLSQLLVCAMGMGILFACVRYLVIPWFDLAPSWAMLSLLVQFLIGWVLMRGWSQEQILEERMLSDENHLNVFGKESADRKTQSTPAQNWRRSEMRQITLPRQVRCFEKRPGGVLVWTMWSLQAGVTIAIGHLETVFWDHNFHEVAPFRYNGQIYYVLIHEVGIQGLVVKLRTRSKFSVVK